MDKENSASSAKEFVLRTGDKIGPYTIERKLGSGGMADVFFAMHGTLHRPAAIKVLRPALATDEVHLQRFMQEARAAASLVHSNIVQVYDVGQDGPIRYIAQEYVPGITLRQYMQENGAMEVRHALSVLLQVLAALKKSSSFGIVHRDIKPDNMLLTSDGEVKVADFGLARLLLQDDPQLTRAGTTLGTPMYMSPEQLQEATVDVRSDLYSLGVTLFHMLAGEPPFKGETPLALAMQQVQSTPPDLKSLRPAIPDSLCSVVQNLLSKNPNDRFSSPDEVLQTLRDARSSDLGECWPDQTIAFPGVSSTAALVGPSQLTLQLQAKIDERKRRAKKRAWSYLGAAAMLLAAAICGVAVARVRPVQPLLGGSDELTVPKQETAEKQFSYALLGPNHNGAELWEAVPRYFPPDLSNSNRYIAGKAWLQLARHYANNSDERASEALRQILDDKSISELLHALAKLEKAAIELNKGNTDDVGRLVDSAKAIKRNLNDQESRILDDNIPSSIQPLWDTNGTR